MSDFLLYVGFSTLETSAVFYLIFKVFKIDIFLKEIIFCSAIIGFSSYVLRKDYELPTVDVAVQLILMFLFIWMMFRIHVFYATILTGMGYQAYLSIQTVYYFAMEKLGLFDSPVPYVLSISTFALQALAAFTAIYIGWTIGKRRSGFDFVPDKQSGRLDLKLWEKVLFALNIPSLFFAIAIVQLAMLFQNLSVILPCMYAAITFGYMYVSYRRDRVLDE